MSFWEDLSPMVRRYIVIGALLVVGLLAFRTCLGGPASEADRPPRGQTPQ
jgi:hypothetical protein